MSDLYPNQGFADAVCNTINANQKGLPMPAQHNHCYHADESYQDRVTSLFQVIKVTRDEPGYEVAVTSPTLDQAVETAKSMNDRLGLTPEEILDIRASSMRASNIERRPTAHDKVSDLLGPELPLAERQAVLAIVGELEARTTNLRSFDFTVTTAEGATFTPWTDGYAIGYKVTAPGLPDRYLFFNPSSDTGEDILHTNAFVYLEADPADQVNTHHHYDIWDEEDR